MSRFFITGGAGFIGSHLVERLLHDGHQVTAYDDFSTGQRAHLEAAQRLPGFRLVEGDVLDGDLLAAALEGHDAVFHLAANADVRHGTQHPRRDLEQNSLATFGLLEAMHARGVRRLAFASTGSVYGEPEVFPTPEDCPFPVQTSFYGASKLAGEGLIAAFCTSFGFEACVFRLVSVLGERYSHGHVFDFVKKLRADPARIEVLGDGRQRKSYVYVQDCIDALVLGFERAQRPFSVLNVGTDAYCTVDESLDWICARLGLQPARRYAGGPRGWVGDSPFIYLDSRRLRALGWAPRLTIREAVLRTVDYLEANSWVLERS